MLAKSLSKHNRFSPENGATGGCSFGPSLWHVELANTFGDLCFLFGDDPRGGIPSNQRVNHMLNTYESPKAYKPGLCRSWWYPKNAERVNHV